MNPRDKRRPFGNINVNQAGGGTNQNDVKGSAAKAPLKPVSQKLLLQSQSVFASKQSSSATSSSCNSTEPPNPVDEDHTTPSVTSRASLPVGDSTFLQQQPVSKEDRINLIWMDDVLTLKPANPLDESVCSDNNTHHHEDDDTLCLPFTRGDETRIFESFETRQLRTIFRPLATEGGFDCMEPLKRANAWDEDDEDESSEAETSSSDGESPTLTSEKEFAREKRTATLHLQDLLPENAPIGYW